MVNFWPMKNWLLFSLFTLSVSPLWAQIDISVVDSVFKSKIKAAAISPLSEQAYCVQEGDGAVQGYQTLKKQRIASVTKLYTTMAAIRNLGINKTYKTEFHYQDGHLHIKGSYDPYFEEEKVFFLIAALNEKGITSLKKITFDDKFLFIDTAPGEHVDLTTAMIQKKLKSYFSTASYGSTINANLSRARKFLKEENLSISIPTLKMSVKEVAFSVANPLTAPTIYSHTSRPLRDILKSMNVMSKNWIAYHLYTESNRVKALATTLKELGLKSEDFLIKNGSGLPFKYTDGSRFDNWATCESVLKLISTRGYELQDIMGTGTDEGTFDDRFLNSTELKEGIMAKTGTLMHTSSLAGVLNTETPTKFAILNHTERTTSARSMQDKFLADLITKTSTKILVLDYTRANIFPLEDKSFLD
jgi:serine-type D-Ala-D-Ala carboxypeptidase/endopeptidase (penicillin-binding protein 4)